MSPEQRHQALEDIKQEIRAAAAEIHAGEVVGCCHRLVDAVLMLSEFLEQHEGQAIARVPVPTKKE
jgi:hypothetical protein